MRVLTVFGTRPEIIRLSLISRLLDRNCDHLTLHTGQNFQANLSKIFFSELDLRAPDIELGIESTSFADQFGKIVSGVDRALDELRPDKVLILGDTNSGLAAIAAARRRIPVFHMEAGNRCYDDRVPEEVNRRVIDHASTILLPYTHRSKENLVREGIERDRIFVIGNPIYEVLRHFREPIESSSALDAHGLERGQYLLATIHRAENVDDPAVLREILSAFAALSEEFERPVLVSTHPRTAEKLGGAGITSGSDVRFADAMGFFDFVKLERNAFAVLTDSGTVQEECSIFHVPNVTVRNVTERPETVECGSNIIGGTSSGSIRAAVKVAVSTELEWAPPVEYLKTSVASTVCKIVLGLTSLREHH